jgi:DHA1 family bicyclomycin/chloramphenicol resistance-like MFS transporter
MEQRTPVRASPPRDDGSTPWRLLALLMSMTAIGAMSLNILVPAVPHLAEVLASDKETIQLTISLYMLGLAFAQLFTGSLSDRFGRRPVILAGFSLATFASLAAIAASNAPGLIVARFLQAIGGATGVAVSRAIIRDMFGRERSAQMIGLIASAMAVAPMIAPFIGGLLDAAFGWEAIFLFAATASFGVLVWSWRMLPETRHAATPGEERGSLGRNLRTLFTSPRFYGYIFSAAVGSGAFFVFVGAGPHVIISIMQRSPAAYGLWFIPTAGGYILGNFITSRLSVRHGVDRMLWWGALIELAGGIMGVAMLPLIDVYGPPGLVIAATVMGVGNGIMLPNAIAGAVSIRAQAAGTASGLLGFTQMSFGALTTQLAGHLVVGAASATPMLVHMLAMGVACVAVFIIFLRARSTPR